MASVNESLRSADRGQLLLIGGLALAISLVAIALVLNSAIYTHNLASRYDSPADGVAGTNGDVRDSVGGVIEQANRYGEANDLPYSHPSDPDVVGNYTDGVPDLESELAKSGAMDGRIVRVSHIAGSQTQGVRIVDAESGGSDFASATGATDWAVVEDARVRDFEITARASGTNSVSTSTLVGVFFGTDAFSIGIDEDEDGTDEWELSIYEDADTTDDDISVTVENQDTGEASTCTAEGSTVTVDITDARIGSQECEALLFLEELDGPYDIRFVGGDRISGSYRLVADGVADGPGVATGPFTDRVDAANYGYHCGSSGTPQSTFHEATSSSYPRISPAIYAVDVETVYDSESVTYGGTHRIAPGEAGRPPQTPRITSFTVSEDDATDDNDGRFTVSWSVVDPNGDSVTVDVDAVDASGDTVSVPSNGATVDLEDNDGPYSFTISASDGSNVRETTQTHADDGDNAGCLP